MIEQQSWVLNNSFGPISLRNYLWIFAKIVHSEHIVIFMLDLRKKNSIRKCKKLFTIVFLLISMRSFLFIISFVFPCMGAELKSGYPDYPKSGLTRPFSLGIKTTLVFSVVVRTAQPQLC